MIFSSCRVVCYGPLQNKQLDTLLRHLPRALRPIPDKQGWLLKQGESVVKEWKRKYCILGRGQLIYYSSMLVRAFVCVRGGQYVCAGLCQHACCVGQL